MTLDEIADLVASPQVEIISFGNYVNRRGVRGYYIQLKFGHQWCRISVSHADSHKDRITVGELDEIAAASLEPVVSVPRESISAAARVAAAREVRVHRYVNHTNVEGFWAEFVHQQNWYMVSVSKIDIPVSATPHQLDQIADELLIGQSRKARKRNLRRKHRL